MADFEDANTPTWANVVGGHVNLIDAIDRTITYDASDGKHYELAEETATLLVRPRGWHLNDKHVTIDGEPRSSGGLLDFGLYFFHNAKRLLDAGSRPVLLPAEDGAPPRGAAVERRLRLRRGGRSASRTARSARPC